MNKFCQLLTSGKPLVTAECLPPCGADADAIRNAADALPQNIDAIVVPDNPDHIRSSAFSTAALLVREGRASVIMTVTTRDRNRQGLFSHVLGAAALDVPSVLCVSGNHQSLSICGQAASVNDMDSIQLVQALKGMVLYGSGPNGRELESKITLQIGAVAQPFLRPMDLNLLRLKKKISVGADFLMTQSVFDVESFSEWMTAVRESGFDKRTAIIASVLILDSAEKALKLRKLRTYGTISDEALSRIAGAADPASEGVALAAETAKKLKKIAGVRGIHILCGGCEALAGEVIKQAGL